MATNSSTIDYPADALSIFPVELRKRIEPNVVLQGKHWIWQRDANNNVPGKYLVKIDGRRYNVATLLFNLVFGGKDNTKSACEVEHCIGPLCQRSVKMTPEERYANFLTKVTEPNENGCTYYIDDTKQRCVVTDDGTTRPAHVYACDLHNPQTKNDPRLTQVGHSCRSPKDEHGHSRRNYCVTKGHSKHVTPKQNASKKEEDGTVLHGDNHPLTKIPDAEIPKILSRLAAGELARCVAKDYNVSKGVIYGIRCGLKRQRTTNPQAVEKNLVAQAAVQRGSDFPTKNDFLIAYYNLCCHHVYLESGCIKVDLLAKAQGGYPTISVAGKKRCVTVLIGSIKNNFTLTSNGELLQGCHDPTTCIEKSECCGFDHIRCDTRQSNTLDAISDERKDKVRQMFADFKAGLPMRNIAAKYDESYDTVRRMCSGETYWYITGFPRKAIGKKKDVEEEKEPVLLPSLPSNDESSNPKNWPARGRLALETVYSVQSGLSIEERAQKYGKSIRFLTELDKALAFVQPLRQQKLNDNRNAQHSGTFEQTQKAEEKKVVATKNTQAAQKIDDRKKRKQSSSSILEIVEQTKKRMKMGNDSK